MNDQISTLKDDLSFMRALAEDGRNGPISGGAFLVAAGGLYAAACLVQWAGVERIGGLDAQSAGWSWLVATGLWILTFFGLLALQHRKPAPPSAVGRVFSVGWSAVGAAILVNATAVWIAAERLHDQALFVCLAPTVLAFYGAAWLVAAAAARKAWMLVTGLGAFTLALAMAALVNDPRELLAYAIALVALLVAPGLYMMRAAATCSTSAAGA